MKILLNKLAIILSVFCILTACEDAIQVNSGITDPIADPSKAPTGVATGAVIDNLGTSAVISSSVTGEGGSKLLDNGVILSEKNDFTIATSGVIIAASKTVATGAFSATATGLTKSKLYYYRAYSYNAEGISYGEIKSFETANVTFSPYRTQFRPTVPADIADWVFDKYTGFDESGEDLVWFTTISSRTGVATYWAGEDLTITSPLVRIANSADELKFQFIPSYYESEEIIVKVYITEDLNNYGEPVKNWNFGYDDYGLYSTTIPMAAYNGKSVYVVIVVEAGDFFICNFSIAPPA